MIKNIFALFMVFLFISLSLINGEEYSSITDISRLPPLIFDRVSERLILIVSSGIHDYRFLVLETDGIGTLEVRAQKNESGFYELFVNYNERLIVNGERVDIDIEMNFFIYRGNIYSGTDLIGISPFLFDIPITFDYLLSGDVDPRYLGSQINYPDKPALVRGAYDLEVILLMSEYVIEASKLGYEETPSKIAFPIYKAEVRGRIPLKSMFVLPAYLLPGDIIKMLNNIAKSVSVFEEIQISFIYLDIVLSKEYIDLYRDFVVNEVVCINLCPTVQVDIQAVITLSMLIILFLIIIYIKRG